MLQFFRKHQKYFFIFTTIIIVTSFAFFGSYQAFAPSPGGGRGSDPVAFEAVDGKSIKSSYLDHMTHFLEREEWMQSTKIFDANFLNDGVISKDFLEGGLSAHMVAHFGEEYRDELQTRLAREKNFTPYEHPYLHSLSAESVWSLFAPEIPAKLATLKGSEDPIAAFDARVDLFLAERNFPPAFLTQMLRYQERDQSRMPPDQRLYKDVVSLFGYHGHADWFGEPFVESIAKMVINTAAIARQKGYAVSRQEAMTELLFKSQKTYEAIAESVDLPVENGQGFLQLYMRHKGLDEETLVRLWEEITLFRRMMHEVGSAPLVDALPLEQFYSYANENATVELYQMAPELRLATDEDKKLFGAYLQAVSPRQDNAIPVEFASVAIVEARAPQIVGKRYRIYAATVDKKALQARVSVKETWDWELANWEELKRTFPELALKGGTPFEILDNLENRSKIDAYACAAIVDAHPEWTEAAVKEADMKEMVVFLSPTYLNEPLPGVTDIAAFQRTLDEQDEIINYSQDNTHFYRLLVDERSSDKEILSFKEAKERLEPLASAPAISFATYLKNHREDESALWKIEKKEMKVSRANETFIPLASVLELEGEAYSEVAVDEIEGAYCFRLKEVFVDTSIPMQKWIEAQEILAKEMRAQFFEGVLTEVCSKN